VIQQSKTLLRLISGLQEPHCQRLAFLWCCFLRWTPLRVSALGDETLSTLLIRFNRGLPELIRLTQKQVGWATKPLGDDIRPEARRLLKDCANAPLAAEIKRWCDRIKERAARAAGEESLIPFAYLSGCLPGIGK